MIENDQLINRERIAYRRRVLEFEKLDVVNDELYALNSLTESIIGINYKTGEAILKARISSEMKTFPRFRILIENNSVLYLVPCLENYIAKYDLTSQQYNKIALPAQCDFGKEKRGFVSCLKTDKYLVMYGFQPMVLFLSFEDDSITICDSWRDMYDKVELEPWFWKDAFEKDGYVYLLPYNYSYDLLKISLRDFSAETLKLGHGKISGTFQFVGLDKNTNKIYFLHSQDGINGNIDNLISWNNDSGEIEVVPLCTMIPPYKMRGSFEGRFVINNKILLLPGNCSKGYVINLNGYGVKELLVPSTEKLCEGFLSIYNYSAFVENENCIYSIFSWEEKIICIDVEKDTIREKNIIFDDASETKLRDIIDCRISNNEKYANRGLRSYLSSLTNCIE